MKKIHQEVTEKIIAQLEKGIIPWAQPWKGIGAPHNFVTKNRYSGINRLLLSMQAQFRQAGYLTYKQTLDLGGHVRKGEKGTTIFFASQFVPEQNKRKAELTGNDPEAVFFLKPYTVFNIEQCEGLPIEAAKPVPESAKIKAADDLITASGANISIGGEKACYIPMLDLIRIPAQNSFHEPINFYRTVFHELSHWTGSSQRLNRNQDSQFGSPEYAFEELVAEISAAFICAELGIQPTVRHADYVGSWLKVLQNDHKAIFKASREATKAAEWITNPGNKEKLSLAA